MTTAGKGRADHLELGDWNAQCYQCGRKRKAGTLLRHWQGYYVCAEHWEMRQPQDFVRSVPDNMTPPWAQPMAEYIYAANAPTTVTVTATQSGALFTFTPDTTITTGTFITIETSSGPIGPFPVDAELTAGEEITLVLLAIPGTGNANGQGARYYWYDAEAANPTRSLVSPDTYTAPVNAGYSVEVLLVDSFGVAVAGKTITLTSDKDGLTLSGSPQVTDVNGYCELTFTVADYADRVYTLTVTDTTDGIELTTHPVITVVWEQPIEIAGGTDVDLWVAAGSPDDAYAYNWIFTVTDDVTTMTLGSWPSFAAPSVLTIINEAYIYGASGDGGICRAPNPAAPSGTQNGVAGGNALDLEGVDVEIDNSAGYIFGGGGGGGAGASTAFAGGVSQSGGGGGGGSPAGVGGSRYTSFGVSDSPPYSGAFSRAHAGGIIDYNSIGTTTDGIDSATVSTLPVAGFNGTSSYPGVGGAGGTGSFINNGVPEYNSTSGAGGDGGDFGEAGEAGVSVAADAYQSGSTGGDGGAAGKAIELNGGAITWIAGNTADRVKGVVS